MNASTRFSAVLLLVIMVISCDSIFSPSDNDDSVVFSSSFETKASIEIWNGYGISRSDEPCPGGGAHSAHVSGGGCIFTYASFDLPQSKRDRYLTISFWAKLLKSGGGVEFSVIDLSPKKWITINDTTWTYYQTSLPLFCPANHIPRIQMSSGGPDYDGAMLVDLIVVEALSPSEPVPPLYTGKWWGFWIPEEFNGLPFYQAFFGFELSDSEIGHGGAEAQIITESVSFYSQFSNFDISVDAQGNITGNGTWYLGTPLGEMLAQSPAEIHGQLNGSWHRLGSLGTGTFTFNHEGTEYSVTWTVAPH